MKALGERRRDVVEQDLRSTFADALGDLRRQQARSLRQDRPDHTC